MQIGSDDAFESKEWVGEGQDLHVSKIWNLKKEEVYFENIIKKNNKK